MSRLRIIGISLLLIYAPLLITMVFNLVPPFTTYNIASFLRAAVFVGLILFVVFLLFLVVLLVLPERLWSIYTGLFTFLYLVFVFGFYCLISSEAPNFAGLLLNASIIPTLFLLRALWLICIITALFMLLMRADKKTTVYVLCATFFFSSGFVAAKELRFRHEMASFFGDFREGQIIFATSYTSDQQAYAFYLEDLKFRRFSENEFARIRGKTRHLFTETFSPDANFKAYEYAYDRDDLSKIFVTQIKTGRTVLLAAGVNPVWLER